MRENYVKKLILDDLTNLINIMLSINKSDISVIAMGLMPYMCLIVNEAYDWCIRSNIKIDEFKSKSVLEVMRSRTKLFNNDKYLSYTNHTDELNELVKSSYAYFKNIAKPYCPDCLIVDTGVYFSNNIYVGNTIQYSFDYYKLSTENKAVFELDKEVYNFAAEIGECIQNIFYTLSGEKLKIIKPYVNINITSKDYRFSKSFVNINNLLVFCLSCRINFLLEFKNLLKINFILYLRFIYLTFYSIKNDLDIMQIEYGDIFEFYYNRNFRNIMAHYSLYGKIIDTEFVSDVNGFGIVEKYFNVSSENLTDIIVNKLYEILSLLEVRFSLKL